MQIVDFANSYVTFFTKPHDGSNIARIQLDAVCTITDDRSGAAETYHLIAPCRSEHMYRDEWLFRTPNYEFCGIFTRESCLLIRTHWTSDRDWRERGRNTDRFARVEIDLSHWPEARALTDRTAIVRATLANHPLVARTELVDDARGLHAVLEYPIRTQNVVEDPPQFQVDAGPLLLPDFSSTAPHLIERFDLAHVVYNRFDRAEFVLRRPIPVGERDGASLSVTDYTVIQVFPAKNEIWCAIIAGDSEGVP